MHSSAPTTHIERLGPVRGRSAESENLGSNVGDADLVVAVAVLLLEHEPDRLVDVDQERPARRRLLIVRETAGAQQRFVSVSRQRLGVSAERERPADLPTSALESSDDARHCEAA